MGQPKLAGRHCLLLPWLSLEAELMNSSRKGDGQRQVTSAEEGSRKKHELHNHTSMRSFMVPSSIHLFSL